ncbi:MAG: hypothetical protein IAB81_06895 [Bacteroidetes bacterium]|uniref:Lipoprotein n=2 Tax=Candidatus Merdivivens TaxID=2840533 RepID=A0A9D9IY21_9BACT|nr:hypothetical protein [Candidatus Merdivivens pullicola]MBO8481064.1 hypothetical protein [Candidatus Merdivivens faecigallinarum]
MKLKLNKALPAIVVLLFSAVSCIEMDPGTGYDLIPEDQLLKTRQKTIDLPVSLKMADSIATTSGTSIVFGSINSERTGTSKYGCATTLVPIPDSSVIDVGSNRRIKEFYLALELRRTECMDESSKHILQNVYVYRMLKDFDSTTVYNCSMTDDYYDRSNPISLPGITYNGGDTLNILLSHEYAAEILDILADDPAIVDTLSDFNKILHGIYIETGEPLAGINEGRVNNFKIQSYGRIRYTADFGERKDIDTSVLFGTGITSNSVSTYFALNTSSLGSKGFETESATESILVEGNSGIKPVISSTDITEAVKGIASEEGVTTDRIMISRASIIMPYEFPADYTELDELYPSILSPSIKLHTEDGRVLYTCISDVNISDEDPGNINRSLGQYSPDITHYLQRLLKKETDELSEDDDIWLIPTTDEADSNDEDTSDDSESSYYYNYYNPYYYYDPYGYGYGYGYGGYYDYYGYNPYGYYGNSYYGTSDESSSETITLDNVSYFSAVLNGTEAERRPRLVITYIILPEEK